MANSSLQHKAQAAKLETIHIALITVSDTRNKETDKNAQYLQKQIEDLGHKISGYHLIKDEPDQIEQALTAVCQNETQIVLINGGTGISSRDTTYDIVSQKLEKIIPGFGELFRMFSYEEVGAAAMLSRAVAGVFQKRVVISMPGSPNAVKLAWSKLIQPELQHLAWEVIR